MIRPDLDRCDACGQAAGAEPLCASCGASLLVDLVIGQPLADERARFRAAQELATRTGVPFSAAKAGLGAPAGVPLARRLDRAAARTLREALARHGVVTGARPAPSRRRVRPLALVLGGLAALALLGAGLALWLRGAPERPGLASTPTPATEAKGAAPGRPPEPGPAEPSNRLATPEIASRATRAVAQVSCRDRSGTAFFVSPERAVTNAHVACGRGETLQVRLHDGRELMGRTAIWLEQPDLALIEVPGASASPLALGDSTLLAPGDAVVLIGNPGGLTFTVHEGRVSFAARNLFGIAWVQLNAAVNPGNSGGPLLDGQGRVVGVVSLKAAAADGIGFALPIEYVRSRLPDDRGQTPEQLARWNAVLARAREEDAREVEAFRARFQKPALLAATLGGGGRLVATVLFRAPRAPPTLRLRAEVRDGDRVACGADGAVEQWVGVESGLRDELRRSPEEPRLRWAVERGVAQGLHVGGMVLSLGHCRPEDIPELAVLALRDGEPGDRPVQFPGSAFAEALRRDDEARAQRGSRARGEEERLARSESQWREAFRSARQSVTELDETRQRLRQKASSASLDWREQGDLAQTEARLLRARDQLDELEREASLQGVPRHWRQ
ncbi:MAG TPA: trypsin-like peptidase domain-containing protein [Anaeromyxobacteraceae bacterium]|nr:trypsin-like peptidase domain-containing protein [Anaeromyxobacteraceae bacterium]